MKENFDNYVKEYDFNVEMIDYKYHHSYRVMEKSINIAKFLNLDEENTYISSLIGLLHDIGRFDQIKSYNTCNDLISFDHGDYAEKLLFEKNMIRNYIKNSKYDSIIRKAIKCHNKYKIENCNEIELLHCKIIRDADKLDIFEHYVNNFKNIELKDEIISDNVFEDAINYKSIDFKTIKTDLDRNLLAMCMVYDFNFLYSFRQIKEKNIISTLCDILSSKIQDENVIKKIKTVQKKLEEFVDFNIGGNSDVR